MATEVKSKAKATKAKAAKPAGDKAPKATKAKAPAAEKSSAPSVTSGAQGWHYALLRYPLVTEKTSLVGGGGERVVFKVPLTSTKLEIKEAVEKIFKVNVRGVNTINVQGKMKRGTHGTGRRAGFKKAYVTLNKGQTVSIVEGL